MMEKYFWIFEIKRFLSVVPFKNLGAIPLRQLLAASFNPEFNAEFLPALYIPFG